MALKKCPRCEVNYIKEDETCCDVCKRYEKNRGKPDADSESITMCIECGENPAVKGGELCAICLRESRRQEKLDKPIQELTVDGGVTLPDVELSDLETPLPGDSDIPESELEVIHRELGEDDPEEEDAEDKEVSLDKIRADEYGAADDEDEE